MRRWTVALLAIALASCAKSGLRVDADRGVDGGPTEPPPPPPPEPDVDVVGNWYDCQYSLLLSPDGRARRIHHRLSCESVGRWEVSGRELTIRVEAGDCMEPPGEALVFDALRTAAGLILAERGSGFATALAPEGTPRTRWTIESTDGRGLSTIARVVGDPHEGNGSGCFWSADGECGGLFACQGWIDVWETRGDRFSGKTGCAGECPCGSVIVGTVEPDGSVVGTYNSANCLGTDTGSLRAVPEPER